MNLFSLFAMVVYAAETVISPIPDDITTPQPTVIQKPDVSFGQLLNASVEPAILGTMTIAATATPQPEADRPLDEIPTPTIATRTTRKQQMTVTLLGDSMIDTLGPDGGGLAAILHKTYPRTTFTVINHGVGAENIDSGLNRLTHGYPYLGSDRPSVVSQNPDVVVVESFGYNPYSFDTGALDRHWLQLSAIVTTLRNELPAANLVIAATIAPNWDVFGDGAPFINMSAEGKREKVQTIKSYIESTIGFAKSEHLPLADAYHPSLGSDGNGKLLYINGGDHIHYSDAGRSLMAQKIAETITTNRLLE